MVNSFGFVCCRAVGDEQRNAGARKNPDPVCVCFGFEGAAVINFRFSFLIGEDEAEDVVSFDCENGFEVGFEHLLSAKVPQTICCVPR